MVITNTTPTTVTEALKATRALIADPAHWTTHKMASDETGKDIWDWHNMRPSKPPTCYCLIGALSTVCSWYIARPGVLYSAAREALKRAMAQLYKGKVPDETMLATYLNDQLGHAAVVRVLDLAIEQSGWPE